MRKPNDLGVCEHREVGAAPKWSYKEFYAKTSSRLAKLSCLRQIKLKT
jgi:hypothetical protein